MKPTLSARFSKKGRANGRDNTVMRTLGYCFANELTTGTSIATSPMAENLIMRMLGVFNFLNYKMKNNKIQVSI
jgi:hypothetical protein